MRFTGISPISVPETTAEQVEFVRATRIAKNWYSRSPGIGRNDQGQKSFPGKRDEDVKLSTAGGSRTCTQNATISLLPKGPFTHAIFDAISITNRALTRRNAWIGKKAIKYYLKTPFFPISANLAVFCRSVTRLKKPCGVGWGRFCTQNRSKNRMCKRDLMKPSRSHIPTKGSECGALGIPD